MHDTLDREIKFTSRDLGVSQLVASASHPQRADTDAPVLLRMLTYSFPVHPAAYTRGDATLCC